MRSRKKLTQRELRELQATPGLVIRRISPEGRTSVEELVTAVSGNKTTRLFITRLEKGEE